MNVRVILLVILAALTGCDKLKVTPVSVADTPLVGNWYAEHKEQIGEDIAYDRFLLRVMESGYVDYHFLSCDIGEQVQEKRLDLHEMPIKRLTSVKMVLQTFPLTPKFELTLGRWPDQNAGVWEVDGMHLQAVDQNNLPDPSLWRCEAASLQ